MDLQSSGTLSRLCEVLVSAAKQRRHDFRNIPELLISLRVNVHRLILLLSAQL